MLILDTRDLRAHCSVDCVVVERSQRLAPILKMGNCDVGGLLGSIFWETWIFHFSVRTDSCLRLRQVSIASPYFAGTVPRRLTWSPCWTRRRCRRFL